MEPTANLLPVLVLVHGDSFDFGSGNLFDVRRYVNRHRQIVVTLNYRLNILGEYTTSTTAKTTTTTTITTAKTTTRKGVAGVGGLWSRPPRRQPPAGPLEGQTPKRDINSTSAWLHPIGGRVCCWPEAEFSSFWCLVTFVWLAGWLGGLRGPNSRRRVIMANKFNLTGPKLINQTRRVYLSAHRRPPRIDEMVDDAGQQDEPRANLTNVAHPTTTGFPPAKWAPAAANLGLLDQLAALHWVRANIHSFGGSPADVSLLGVKRGAICVHLLMLSPLAKGEFLVVVVVVVATVLAPNSETSQANIITSTSKLKSRRFALSGQGESNCFARQLNGPLGPLPERSAM